MKLKATLTLIAASLFLAACDQSGSAAKETSKAETAKKLGITTSYITVSMRRAADKLKLPVMFAWYGYHNLK